MGDERGKDREDADVLVESEVGPVRPLGAQGPDRLITQPNRYADEGHLPLRAILQRTGAAQEMRLGGDGGYNNGLARLDNTARDPLAQTVSPALPLIGGEADRLVNQDLGRPAVQDGERRALHIHVT